MVFGASGAFKSFYTLDAALHIAQTKPVTYIAAEGVGGLGKRVAAWCEHNKTSPGRIQFLPHEVNILNSEQVIRLINALKPTRPAITIFDTLARCIPGGDENSAKDMGIAVRNAAIIQREAGTAVTWIHHSNRAERGERGSGAIRGAADAMIEINANGDNVIRVSCSKSKEDEPWAMEELRFHAVGESGVLVPVTFLDRQKVSKQGLEILRFLALEVFETSGAKANQIINGVNIPERKVYDVLSHLKRELLIQHDSKGDPYRLTQGGKDMLCKSYPKIAQVVNFPREIEIEE